MTIPEPGGATTRTRFGLPDHRAVPLEVLREFTRSMVEMSSIRLVAGDAGVNRSTVHKFITAESTPHPRVRRLLALWYLRRVAGIDELELVRPYAAALDVLMAQVPDHALPRVTLDVLVAIQQGFAAGGEEPPRWIDAIFKRHVADRVEPDEASPDGEIAQDVGEEITNAAR